MKHQYTKILYKQRKDNAEKRELIIFGLKMQKNMLRKDIDNVIAEVKRQVEEGYLLYN